MNTDLLDKTEQSNLKMNSKPSRSEAEQAVRVLIAFAGDDPNREGVQDTPSRVVDAYAELFSGYACSEYKILGRTFEDSERYGEIVLLKNIRVESFCEHHMIPIIGVAHVAYIARSRLVGLSKLARLVDMYAKRLQTQEGLTAQIAHALERVLNPLGVAVIVDAAHQCMTMRGVYKPDATTVTEKMTGCFKEDAVMRERFYRLIQMS
ncbi:MAG: GTP cyclohydrolase I FolE [Legionellales bacterium]|nr:GTP cyclohydrolase I FolE [Legionellales bacterium]